MPDAFSCSGFVLRVLRHNSMAPQGTLMTAVCACECVLRASECVCVANSSESSAVWMWRGKREQRPRGEETEVLTRCVQWPHTVSLNIFPLPLRPHLSAPAGSFSCFYLFWLHFIYLIGVPALLSCVLSHVGFSEQPSLIVRLSKTGQSPLWCPNFYWLGKQSLFKNHRTYLM